MMYASLADLKTYLGIAPATTTDDALLTRLLEAASAAISAWCKRQFRADADTTVSLYADEGDIIRLPSELVALTSATADGAALDTAQIRGWPSAAAPWSALRLRVGSWGDDVTLTGRWAYSLTPPDDIEQAAIRWAAHMYRIKDAAVFDASASPDTGQIVVRRGIPDDVYMLIKPYKFRVVA